MSELGTISDALIAAGPSNRGIRTIEHDGRSLLLSYETLLSDSLKVAGGLYAHGLATGDRVALVLPGVGDFIHAFFGITAAGLVPVPLCPPTQAGDLPTFARQSRHILLASRANAVVTSEDVAPLLDVAGIDGLSVITIESLSTRRRSRRRHACRSTRRRCCSSRRDRRRRRKASS